VEEHAVLRAGLRALLEADSSISVAGEASELDQAVTLASHTSPDVILIHAHHDNLDTHEAIARLSAHGELASANVLVLTTRDSDDYVLGALQAGASGLLFKETEPEDLVGAVRMLAMRHALLAPGRGRRALSLVASSA
jgi:DNA-binding NarL/FixJ family response regulator